MCLARSRPTVLTWFMDASWSGLQHPQFGTPRPSGGAHHQAPRRRGGLRARVQGALDAESRPGEAQRFRQRRRLSSKALVQRSRALSSADFCTGDSGRRLTTSPISTLGSASLLFLGDLSAGAMVRATEGRGTGAGLVATRRARSRPPLAAAARLLAAVKRGAYSPPNRNNTGLRCSSPAGPTAR